jgi:acyl-[acyl-carrier-protein]--UDP-N-acetylglucosamine O-acyltransferase (EC 2.3.1.129)
VKKELAEQADSEPALALFIDFFERSTRGVIR